MVAVENRIIILKSRKTSYRWVAWKQKAFSKHSLFSAITKKLCCEEIVENG